MRENSSSSRENHCFELLKRSIIQGGLLLKSRPTFAGGSLCRSCAVPPTLCVVFRVRLLVFVTAQGLLLFEEDFGEGFHSFADDDVLKGGLTNVVSVR